MAATELDRIWNRHEKLQSVQCVHYELRRLRARVTWDSAYGISSRPFAVDRRRSMAAIRLVKKADIVTHLYCRSTASTP